MLESQKQQEQTLEMLFSPSHSFHMTAKNRCQ